MISSKSSSFCFVIFFISFLHFTHLSQITFCITTHHLWVFTKSIEVNKGVMESFNVHLLIYALNKFFCSCMRFLTHSFKQFNSRLFQLKNLSKKHAKNTSMNALMYYSCKRTSLNQCSLQDVINSVNYFVLEKNLLIGKISLYTNN